MNASNKCVVAVFIVMVLIIVPAGRVYGGDPLEGTRWKLVGWTLDSIDPADVTITAAFDDGRVTGFSGANIYSGPYETGKAGTFTAGLFICTKKGGPEPAMRAESAFLELLRQARSFKLKKNRLTLHDKGGFESLIFERADERRFFDRGQRLNQETRMNIVNVPASGKQSFREGRN